MAKIILINAEIVINNGFRYFIATAYLDFALNMPHY